MTQYQDSSNRPNTESVSPAPAMVRPADLRALSERLDSQYHELQELRQTVRRLQNELRSAVNAFNLRRHG